MVRAAVVLVSLSLFACTRREPNNPIEPPEPAPLDGACAVYERPVEVGATPPELPELSGLAASRLHPGVYWAHNDSGNATELFAIDETGKVLARHPLSGGEARDAEDIAVGPCGAKDPESCIYLADIGDNLRSRDDVQIFKVREPTGPLQSGTLSAEVLRFRYPDGAHNAESLVVDPESAALYVITKTDASLGDVYRMDPAGAGAGAGDDGAAVKLGTLHARGDSDRVSTGADWHPTAMRLLVRTYGHLWEFRGDGARTIEDLLTTEGVELTAAPSQVQSEAVAYTADGRGYLLGSEGVSSPLFRAGCRP